MKKNYMTKEQWIYIAKNYEKEGAKSIAAKLKVSNHRIRQSVYTLRKHGIKIGRPKTVGSKSSLLEAVMELKKERFVPAESKLRKYWENAEI